MCEIFNVARSSYYDWLKRDYSKDNDIKEVIKNIFYDSRETYGIKRIQAELISIGKPMGHNKVAKLKQELGLYPEIRRKHKVTTDSKNNKMIFDNVLNRDFASNVLREKVVSDITYISTLECWIYLATRKVISYADMIINIIESGLNGNKIPS